MSNARLEPARMTGWASTIAQGVRRRWRARGAAAARAGLRGVLIVMGLAAAGCGTGSGEGLAPRPNPSERMQLEQRALNLLRVAAASEADVVRCHAMEALAQLEERSAGAEFRAGAQASEPLVRFAGLVSGGQIRDTGILPLARDAMRHTDVRVRLGGAFAAVRLGDQNAARVLTSTLLDHPDANLRSDAAWLLGKLGEPKARRWLELALSREQSHRVRVHIFAAQAALGDAAAIDALTTYTQVDAEARVLALQSLAELKQARTRSVLEYRLGPDEQFTEMRLIAARGLGWLGSSAGYDLARRNLTAEFNDRDDPNRTHRIRSLSALALGAIGDSRALPLLRQLAETDTDERTQVAAALAIVQICRR